MIITVEPVTEPPVGAVVAVAERFVVARAILSVIAGELGSEKSAPKPRVIVSPALSVPLALDVNPTVQVERAPPV